MKEIIHVSNNRNTGILKLLLLLTVFDTLRTALLQDNCLLSCVIFMCHINYIDNLTSFDCAQYYSPRWHPCGNISKRYALKHSGIPITKPNKTCRSFQVQIVSQ